MELVIQRSLLTACLLFKLSCDKLPSSLDTEVFPCLVPFVESLLERWSLCAESVRVGRDNSLEVLWVSEHFNAVFVVTHEVVVHFNSPRLLSLDNDITDPDEKFINFTVLVIEDLGSLVAAGTLVGLQYDKECPDELLAFRHEKILVQVDSEVVLIT